MRYVSRRGIVLTDVAGEHVLIAAQRLRKEVPYITILNDTGAFCWQCLTEGTGEEELCTKIKDEFDVEDEELMREDVASLLNQLKQKHYIQEVNDDE